MHKVSVADVVKTLGGNACDNEAREIRSCSWLHAACLIAFLFSYATIIIPNY